MTETRDAPPSDAEPRRNEVTPNVTLSFELSPEGVAQMLVAALGQNGYDVNHVVFQCEDTGDSGPQLAYAKVVCNAPELSVRSTPEEKPTVSDQYREYMSGLRESGMLLDPPDTRPGRRGNEQGGQA